MDRRNFMKSFAAGMLALGIEGDSRLMAQALDKRERFLAVTMDDPNLNQTPLMSPEKRNRTILEHLNSHKIRAALFVCGQRIDNPEGQRLLAEWNHDGHVLGNHSYSHLYYHSDKIGSAKYIEDIKKCETIVSAYSNYSRRFRYPFLKEGNTAEKRDSIRKFLKDNGLKHGYVTIDTSDWYVDDRLEQKLKSNPGLELNPYKEFYLEHILQRAEYYDMLARNALGRPVKHTLLIHHTLLNALFLGDLLDALTRNGWSLIDASAAFKDPLFDYEPNILPTGESVIWSIAKESGKFEKLLRYPGEDSSYEEGRMDKLGL